LKQVRAIVPTGPHLCAALAAQQVERLDARRALVERGDARVAGDLLHAVLFDVAVATEDLHTQVGALEAHLGEEALEDRRVEAEALVPTSSRSLSLPASTATDM
jgi:hypothetical protein